MYVEVAADVLEMNPFTAIGKDGFLITAGSPEHFNVMTASWGAMGVLWGRNMVTVFVRGSRHTHKFLEESDGFTCSFLGSDMKDTLLWCGQHSGRDGDKIAATGLQPDYIPTDSGPDRVTFRQASLVFSCTKASVMQIEKSQFVLPEIEEHYGDEDYHTVYVGFIDKILANQ
ncbi:flavin reductase family protein [Sphaerochaeta sp. PS]|uniref:flavin reductase family protein n=1 Tax=Sphaerochaeta sp. PS TaxID=3076336 RepID=UPI0028A47C3A|nr:flavin reductase [Sphaerochaeta sp. PS]MDT4762542.1 flavin reductase [Sphaerochaeta sp. PS]